MRIVFNMVWLPYASIRLNAWRMRHWIKVPCSPEKIWRFASSIVVCVPSVETCKPWRREAWWFRCVRSKKDAGRALSHRVQVVELYLKRQTFTQIRQRMRHSLLSIANYVITFALVVAHTRDGHTVDETAFLMQISVGLVRQYQDLYERCNLPEYRERIEEMIATVKARGFRPSQLETEAQSAEGQKRGQMV